MGCVSSKPAVEDGPKVAKIHSKDNGKDQAKVNSKPLAKQVSSGSVQLCIYQVKKKDRRHFALLCLQVNSLRLTVQEIGQSLLSGYDW